MSDWKKCLEFLNKASDCVDPKESTRSAFIFVRFCELLDVVGELLKSN